MDSKHKIPKDLTNILVEKGEVIYQPDFQSYVSKGTLHSEDGGNPILMPEGTKIFSRKLKSDADNVKVLLGKDKEMSYADMAKQFPTNDYIRDLLDSKSDKVSKETSKLMLTKNIANLDSIFELQEGTKAKNSQASLETVFKLGGMYKYDNGGYYDDPTLPVGLTEADRRVRKQKIEKQLFTDSPFHLQNLYNTTLYNDPRVEDYQLKSIGYDPKQGYLKDPLNTAIRRDTATHIFDDFAAPNWKHIDLFGIKDGQKIPIVQGGKRLVNDVNGFSDFEFNTRKNRLGNTYPSYVDGDNVRYQPPKFMNDIRDVYDEVTLLPNTIKPLPDLKPKLPTADKLKELVKPVPNKPEATDDPIKRVYMLSMGKDLLDLSSLSMSPPAYNYEPQNIAYQRFLPQNTLAAERQFNLQKEAIENSGMPEQARQAMLSDLYGKLQDNISQVQLQNYQSDLNNDNQNASLYNNVTNQNRAEKIQYNDRYDELLGKTKSNYNQEKQRLTDQLLNTYGKQAENESNMKLLSALGTNYKMINGQIQYVPGQGTRDNSNSMQQFSTNQGDLMKYIQSGLNSSDPKERSTALEMYGKIFGVK